MKFFVPCLPVAQPRPRVTTINGSARMFEAKAAHPIHAFKAAVKAAWNEAGATKLEGPLSAVLEFVFERPTKVPKKLGAGRLLKAKKPDADNLAKGVLDSLNGLAFHDDGQVVFMFVKKYHAAEGETPGVSVRITQADDEAGCSDNFGRFWSGYGNGQERGAEVGGGDL